jgi:molybdate transport system substrate-binding protein
MMRHRLAGCPVRLISLAPPASADTLRVTGAGSLAAAFTDLIHRFPAGPDTVAAPEFGPSGLMREKIEAGAEVDLFASADPRRKAIHHKSKWEKRRCEEFELS